MVSSQTVTLGPEDGSIVVRTYREGAAAKAGHDLVIDVTGWQATVDLPAGSMTLDVDPRSLIVREGVGGVKPLSEQDKARIRAAIDGDVLGGAPISFRSAEVHANGGTIEVAGELTLAGATRPVHASLTPAADGTITATIPVTQTTWGITPRSAMMGQLRVRDAVEVHIEARLP